MNQKLSYFAFALATTALTLTVTGTVLAHLPLCFTGLVVALIAIFLVNLA